MVMKVLVLLLVLSVCSLRCCGVLDVSGLCCLIILCLVMLFSFQKLFMVQWQSNCFCWLKIVRFYVFWFGIGEMKWWLLLEKCVEGLQLGMKQLLGIRQWYISGLFMVILLLLNRWIVLFLGVCLGVLLFYVLFLVGRGMFSVCGVWCFRCRLCLKWICNSMLLIIVSKLLFSFSQKFGSVWFRVMLLFRIQKNSVCCR